MKKYDNYVSNLDVLKHADEQELDNEFVIGGIKDKFCLQFELSWKLLKELLTYEGRAEAATGALRGKSSKRRMRFMISWMRRFGWTCSGIATRARIFTTARKSGGWRSA